MKILKRFIIAIALALVLYFTFGIFVIQPIGAIPEGATIVYFRLGLNTSFISSADGFLLDNDQDVSLLSRMVVLGKFGDLLQTRKIVTLPYSQSLYLISTGGMQFEK